MAIEQAHSQQHFQPAPTLHKGGKTLLVTYSGEHKLTFLLRFVGIINTSKISKWYSILRPPQAIRNQCKIADNIEKFSLSL